MQSASQFECQPANCQSVISPNNQDLRIFDVRIWYNDLICFHFIGLISAERRIVVEDQAAEIEWERKESVSSVEREAISRETAQWAQDLDQEIETEETEAVVGIETETTDADKGQSLALEAPEAGAEITEDIVRKAILLGVTVKEVAETETWSPDQLQHPEARPQRETMETE